MAKCASCKKEVEPAATLFKRKHKGQIYCFCSQECKSEFEKKKGIVDMSK